MEIVLVRHGEPEWVREGLNVDNPPLTARGHAQAQAMAAFLATEHFDEVLCSPLVRARQTAAPLFAALVREEAVEPWLEEIRNPIWHGTPEQKSIEAYREQNRRVSTDRWRGLEGGEPPSEFVERIRLSCSLFLQERGCVRTESPLPVWRVDRPDWKVALVAHAGTNSVVICHLLGLDPTPWEWDRFVIGHGTVSRLQSFAMGDGHAFSLTSLSDDEYLPGDHRTR